MYRICPFHIYIITLNTPLIVIENDNTIDLIVSEDGKTLNVMSNIKPEIIDANFNELDERLSNIEATIKMRILGQLNNLTSKVDKIKID